ncbi:MAG: hypothetical protein ACKOPG_06435 [Novosphingobium sp.]
MGEFDLAVVGSGLLAGLLALHLAKRDPDRSVLLLTEDRDAGGDALELVVEHSLSDAARDLLDPLVVASWPAYLVIRGGETFRREEPVLLVDPVQLWLELGDLLPAGHMLSGCAGLSADGTRLTWKNGMATARKTVDLSPLAEPLGPVELIGMDAVRGLALPVLADLDTGDPQWNAFQHIPLGDERIYIRKRACQGDPEAELTGRFGRILSELLSD